jgi:ferric-dicitrate binding protein FerR (iron transport regulator)
MKKNGKTVRLNTCRRAYFQVQGKTFSVQTADGVVKGIGTHFNVKQRPNYYGKLLRRISKRNL